MHPTLTAFLPRLNYFVPPEEALKLDVVQVPVAKNSAVNRSRGVRAGYVEHNHYARIARGTAKKQTTFAPGRFRSESYGNEHLSFAPFRTRPVGRRACCF